MERLASSRPHRIFLSCPVFGIPRAAESAELILVISGDYFAKKHAAHMLVPAIGKKIMDLGSNVERAVAFKCVIVHLHIFPCLFYLLSLPRLLCVETCLRKLLIDI